MIQMNVIYSSQRSIKTPHHPLYNYIINILLKDRRTKIYFNWLKIRTLLTIIILVKRSIYKPQIYLRFIKLVGSK